ncbi:MAG: hypothetical protein CMP10_07640 [Zetaproteobacteria bacterium]|nr:hypothetical protein [Pseudobdellovibrionaceae bacterium]
MIELTLPIKSLWKINDIIQEANYLTASNEAKSAIYAIHKKIYKMAAPFANSEEDRQWLYQKSE